MNLLQLIVAYALMTVSAGSTALVSQSAKAWLFSCEVSTGAVKQECTQVNRKYLAFTYQRKMDDLNCKEWSEK